ncbi:MAG: hypothetical protein ACREL7_02475 [Longimicrobiales bacterium]
MMTERSMPDDALLVRYIDGEASADERALVESVSAGDPTVAARLAQLEERTKAARAALAQADIAAPAALAAFKPGAARSNIGHSMWLRAALVVGLLGAAALAVPPVRAWVLDVLQRDMSPDVSDSVPGAPVTIDSVMIFFDVPPEFTIELDAAQRDGQVTVRIADVDQATAELRTPGGTESFFVVPEGLRIINGDISTAEYEIVLPRSVREVRVRIPGSPDVMYATADSETRVFELGR